MYCGSRLQMSLTFLKDWLCLSVSCSPCYFGAILQEESGIEIHLLATLKSKVPDTRLIRWNLVSAQHYTSKMFSPQKHLCPLCCCLKFRTQIQSSPFLIPWQYFTSLPLLSWNSVFSWLLWHHSPLVFFSGCVFCLFHPDGFLFHHLTLIYHTYRIQHIFPLPYTTPCSSHILLSSHFSETPESTHLLKLDTN